MPILTTGGVPSSDVFNATQSVNVPPISTPTMYRTPRSPKLTRFIGLTIGLWVPHSKLSSHSGVKGGQIADCRVGCDDPRADFRMIDRPLAARGHLPRRLAEGRGAIHWHRVENDVVGHQPQSWGDGVHFDGAMNRDHRVGSPPQPGPSVARDSHEAAYRSAKGRRSSPPHQPSCPATITRPMRRRKSYSLSVTARVPGSASEKVRNMR